MGELVQLAMNRWCEGCRILGLFLWRQRLGPPSHQNYFSRSCSTMVGHGVSDAELKAFKEVGWCVPSYRLPDATLLGLNSALERLTESNPGVRPEDLVNAHLTGQEGKSQASH